MLQIQHITSAPKQKMTLVLPDGSKVTMSIEFMPQQYGWFITSLTYTDTNQNTFQLNGIRIVNSPNMLHQFKNQIPFGLACYTMGNREPTQQQDFSTATSILYVLTQTDVKNYALYLTGSGNG